MEIQTKTHYDKMNAKLDDRATREKMLEGKLKREDCHNKEVFEFLQLLKRPENAGGT